MRPTACWLKLSVAGKSSESVPSGPSVPPQKKKTEQQPIGVGLTAKQMKRKKPINGDMLRDIEPLTENQQKLFDSYANSKNIIA